MRIAELRLNNWRTPAMAKLDTYKNIFPHAKLTRSPKCAAPDGPQS
jgi:hypothetical protein